MPHQAAVNTGALTAASNTAGAATAAAEATRQSSRAVPQDLPSIITVEVIGSALMSIVEEMGEALIRASYSTNIKERRDCSTALFDLRGNTLCQAEHIPMHLGSFLGLIPHIMKRHPVEEMRPGDVFCGNDAYEGGGTHLPDIVLAEPVFVDGAITAWAVNLAHHAKPEILAPLAEALAPLA